MGKFIKSQIEKNSGSPQETKIHKTPLSKKSQHFKISEQAKEDKFEFRDPRFDANINRTNCNESGWKLRNAYKFLDNYIDRDLNFIKAQIKKNKKAIKFTKKNANKFHPDIQHLIKEKGVAVNALKNELIKIQNRKNQINEKDLEQKNKIANEKNGIDASQKWTKNAISSYIKTNKIWWNKMAANK